LEIQQVQLTAPLMVTEMSNRIEPDAEGRVTVKMQKPLVHGDFYGGVIVHFKNDARDPQKFYMQGEIVPPIEFIPHNVIFLSTQRGQTKSAAVEIVNHESEPLEIQNVECNAARFACELAAVKPGRRYRISVMLKGEGPGEQQTDTIVLPTSSRARPFLEIKAFSKIRDRVYAFPDSIDLQTVDANYLKAHPQMVGVLSQSVMIYQAGGQNLQVVAQTDVPFFHVSTQSSPQFRDRVEVTVSIDPTKLKSGPVKGSISVGTNDPDFPKIVIPVSGRIEGTY
jgi:hypothetical protein